ncbi:MAG TPA: HAD-IA family hydrolase [Vitreimonas sp.]|nr:HAD-IA family hydrolase [Vitreimonas sp.]
MPTLIFDFDGTLADTLQLTVELFNQLAPKYHLQTLGEKDVTTLKDKSAREILKLSGLSPFKLPFLVYDMQQAMKGRIVDFNIFPGLKSVLNKLKKNGVTLGIVTSNSQENVTAFLENNNLKVFDFVHSEKNLWGKGAVLKKVIKNLKLNPAEVFYVGDEVRDIEAARAADLSVISVTWGFNSRKVLSEHHPDHIIDQPEELLSKV